MAVRRLSFFALAVLALAFGTGAVFLRVRRPAADRLRADGAAVRFAREAEANGAAGALALFTFPEAPDRAPCILFETDGADPAAGAARWPFRDVPAPGDLAPSFSGRTRAPDGAEALLAAGSAPGEPAAAFAALCAALDVGGWTPLPPAATSLGTALYARRGAVACAHASRGADGTARWLLLRREAGR